MSFGEAINTVLTKKYATFSGRARRSEFWFYVLFVLVVGAALNALATATHSSALKVIYFIFELAVLIPTIAVTTRRLHDTGRSGWWQFINLIPIIGSIIMLVFEVSDSQPQANSYGPPVKDVVGYPATV